MERLGKTLKLIGIKNWSANSQNTGLKCKGNYDEVKK
jgi:hypothetical protein